MLAVHVCKSCLKASFSTEAASHTDYSDFIAKVEDKLNSADAENRWEVELGPCVDLCPDSKISFAFDTIPAGRKIFITTSELPTIDSVVQKCFETLDDFSKK